MGSNREKNKQSNSAPILFLSIASQSSQGYELDLCGFVTVGENIICAPIYKITFGVLLCYIASHLVIALAIAKITAPYIFPSFFVLVLYIDSLLLFCIALHIVIALPTKVTLIAIDAALFKS